MRRKSETNTMNKWLGESGVFIKVWVEGKNKGFKMFHCTFSVSSVQVSAMDHRDSKDSISKTF